MTVNDGKSANCNKNCEKEFDEDFARRFTSTYKFCDGDIRKFCLILQKGFYPYKYMGKIQWNITARQIKII